MMEVKTAKKTITAVTNVNAGATSQTVYIFALPPESYLMYLFARVKTAFSGVTLPSVEVGISGNTTLYIPKQEINIVRDLLPGSDFCRKIGVPELQEGATGQRSVIATFRSSAGNLSSLTTGEIDFVVIYAE